MASGRCGGHAPSAKGPAFALGVGDLGKPAFGGLGGLLGSLLGGGGAGAGSGAMPGGTAAGLGSLLELNGDGNPLDDIQPMAGKAMR